MNNIQRPALSWLTDYTTSTFLNSGKKHLFLTGTRQIGKSTLFNALVEHREIEILRSFALWNDSGFPSKVILQPPQQGFCCVVGKRTTNGMIACQQTFQSVGAKLLQNLANCSQEWVGIDEIGFLEQCSLIYQQNILQLLEQKRVFAVIRKDEHTFLNQLYSYPDSLLLDLDKIFESNRQT